VRPSFEPRRRKELLDELLTRARAWLADWHPRDDDFATALFKIAARIESAVTERLDRAPDKTFRAFLDWIGVQGRAARAAELPVIFTMTPKSTVPVDAPERVQLQINSGPTPINFETERQLRIVPAALDTIVAVDPARDAFFKPPLGISPMAAPPLQPEAWMLKVPEAAGVTDLQLDPPIGIDPGITLLDPGGHPYVVKQAKGGLVTIDPGLVVALTTTDPLRRATTFTPFSATERNLQEHALYIGSTDALNIESEATIAIVNGASILPDAAWWQSAAPSPTGAWAAFKPEDVSRVGADLVLKKPKGAIEAAKVNGLSSRWLRATRDPGFGDTSTISNLRLLVNCETDWQKIPAVDGVEGIAATTPLVLNAGFYPFGREPRQFDSFYLGSKEAFSKPSAFVDIGFALGASVSNARAVVGLADDSYWTFGVGADSRLQILKHGVLTAPQPASTVDLRSASQPEIEHRPIPLNTNARPGAVSIAGFPHVSVASGSEVWIWRQVPGLAEWTSQGIPFKKSDGTMPHVAETMVTVDGSGAKVYAVADGRLFSRPLDTGSWSQAFPDPNDPSPPQVKVIKVVPVLRLKARAGEQLDSDGIVIVTDQGDVRYDIGAGWKTSNGAPAAGVAQDFYPLVVKSAAGPLYCATRETPQEPAQPLARPAAFDILSNGAGYSAQLTLTGHTLGFRPLHDRILIVMIAKDTTSVADAYVWDAFANLAAVRDTSTPPALLPALVEGPLEVGRSGGIRFFFSAGQLGDAFIVAIGQTESVTGAAVTDGVCFVDPLNAWTALNPGFPIDSDPTSPGTDLVFADTVLIGKASASDWILHLPQPSDPPSGATSALVYPGLHTALRTGVRKAPRTLELAARDAEAVGGVLVYVTKGNTQYVLPVKTVVDPGAGLPLQVTFDAATTPVLPGSTGNHLTYKFVAPAVSENIAVRPLVDTSGLDPSFASSLIGAKLEFRALSPSPQTVVDTAAAGTVAVLGSAWTAAPTQAAYDFVATASLFSPWVTIDAPQPHKPTLSWEYFDGVAWRLIDGLTDSTDNLAHTGDVQFCVPVDLQQTDVVGHKNDWIRARLVGGDYGQETVTVTTVTSGTTSTQTVDRNKDSILAPYVGTLTVKYRVCCPAVPEYVIASDNGGNIDQTDVNKNGNARVEYFVPLGAALANAASGASDARDRAIFLGFDQPITGGPIAILFIVIEGTFDRAYPLRVDALAGNRFVPVEVKDDTRGLSETGLVELSLNEPPQLTELFGVARFWVRLRPSTVLPPTDAWDPNILAAYLNATWAAAADTQVREMLGSSDGSPNQRFRLARKPVLEKTLQLRVFERLGDEDKEKLTQQGFDIKDQLPDIASTNGCWVLWRQVPDTVDEPADSRAYSLDDADGIVTFGDGLHGMIPPIGTDVIVAERYQRGGGEAANEVAAWTKINLVTPLAGVNGVVAPQGAAGGSDPQDSDSTVRFAPANLRTRDRAITPSDFETLALQFSRDVAQARAIPVAGGLRLIVTMDRSDPQPHNADVRELKQYLLDRAAPQAAADGALTVEGPRDVGVRISVTLDVDAIESSGDVKAAAREKLEQLLDDWRIGDLLSETDVAGALADLPHLETIDAVAITTIAGAPLSTVKAFERVRVAAADLTIDTHVAQEALV
jgi:hypothetical protein